jgi:hypothetical protein
MRFVSGRPSRRADLSRLVAFEEQGRYMADRYAAFAELVQNQLEVIETSALLNRREPLPTDKFPSKRLRLAAVDALAALAHQDRAEAERTVNSMVNQMLQLAQQTLWWSADAEAAIADTVDYAAGNHEVRSAAAQQAWDRYRTAQADFVSVGVDLPTLPPDEYEALTGRMHDAEADWLAAWNDWHAIRQQSEPGEA